MKPATDPGVLLSLEAVRVCETRQADDNHHYIQWIVNEHTHGYGEDDLAVRCEGLNVYYWRGQFYEKVDVREMLATSAIADLMKEFDEDTIRLLNLFA